MPEKEKLLELVERLDEDGVFVREDGVEFMFVTKADYDRLSRALKDLREWVSSTARASDNRYEQQAARELLARLDEGE